MRMRGSSDICNEEVVTTDETAVDLTRRDRDRREYSTQYSTYLEMRTSCKRTCTLRLARMNESQAKQSIARKGEKRRVGREAKRTQKEKESSI